MKNELYIISSVFHLLIAIAVTSARPQCKPYFAFIRFNKARYQHLIGCLNAIVQSSKQVLYLEDVPKGLKNRKLNALTLLKFVEEAGIKQVFVGNDRHIEFQYLAYCLKRSNISTECIYLDEGLFSYLGRKASKSFSERIFDQGLKKIFYGFWWQTPKTIGASSYIDEVWLAYPALACPVFQPKDTRQLPTEGFGSELFERFIECWAGLYELPLSMGKADFVITITDEKNFVKFLNYRESIITLVSILVKQGKSVAIKYHPNANNRDLLSLQLISNRVTILPSALPFEVLLPLLPKVTLIAEFSSTLITSRLLAPSMNVWAIVHESVSIQPELVSLCKALAIQRYTIPELKQKVMGF